MPTAEEFQTLILQECQLTTDAIAVAAISTWWDLQGGSTDYITYLHTKRHAVIYWLGKLATSVDISIADDSWTNSQAFRNMHQLLNVIEDQIKAVDPESLVAEYSVATARGNLPSIAEEWQNYYNSGLSLLISEINTLGGTYEC
jgi:hypothetical protein